MTLKPLQQAAYTYLKNQIFSGQMEFDCIYSEMKIAEEIGISRTPVRDAVHLLVQEGLLDIIPSRGFCLHKITEKEILDTFEMRQAIEGHCAALIAAEHGTDHAMETVHSLNRMVKEQRGIMNSSRSLSKFWDIDEEFHLTIIHYSNNLIFRDVFEKYMFRIQDLAIGTHGSLTHRGRMETTVAEHQAIVTAMASGDLMQTHRAMQDHMQVPRDINLLDLKAIQSPRPR